MMYCKRVLRKINKMKKFSMWMSKPGEGTTGLGGKKEPRTQKKEVIFLNANKGVGNRAQSYKCLPGKHKILSSIPIQKEKKKKKSSCRENCQDQRHKNTLVWAMSCKRTGMLGIASTT